MNFKFSNHRQVEAKKRTDAAAGADFPVAFLPSNGFVSNETFRSRLSDRNARYESCVTLDEYSGRRCGEHGETPWWSSALPRLHFQPSLMTSLACGTWSRRQSSYLDAVRTDTSSSPAKMNLAVEVSTTSHTRVTLNPTSIFYSY